MGKKIGLLVFTFVLSVALVFGAFVMLKKDEIKKVEKQAGEKAKSAVPPRKMSKVDSLEALVESLQLKLDLEKTIADSLKKELSAKLALLEKKEAQLAKLDEQLKSAQKRALKAKDIAKTFESMRVNEMKLILQKIDDKMLALIYQNMNSRFRKNLLLALPPSRAARLTKNVIQAKYQS